MLVVQRAETITDGLVGVLRLSQGAGNLLRVPEALRARLRATLTRCCTAVLPAQNRACLPICYQIGLLCVASPTGAQNDAHSEDWIGLVSRAGATGVDRAGSRDAGHQS